MTDLELAKVMALHPWRPETPIKFWYHYDFLGSSEIACFIEMQNHPDHGHYNQQQQLRVSQMPTAPETSDDDNA